MTTELRAACATGALTLVDGQPPKRIHLLSIGANARRDDAQPPYLVADRAHAEQIVAASKAYHRNTDPMVDYDHQSVFGAKDGVGGRAPAAGWMSGLIVTDDGIEADVEWTRAASVAIGRREYRYVSPYFGHAKDGRVTRIFNAALTNRPELELRAVASQADIIEEESPLDKDLLLALGLAEGASAADALAAVRALTADRTAVCSALGLAATADNAAIAVKLGEIKTAASQAGKVDPSAFVPMSEFVRVRDQVAGITESRVTASVDDAIGKGKVAPANRDWALGYAKADPEGFAKFVGGQPEIIGAGVEERRAAAIKADVLTEEEKAICTQMGVTPEAFLKSRKEFLA